MVCPNCKKDNAPKANSCEQCGYLLTQIITKKKSLSTGAIVGITLGSVFGGLVLITALLLVIFTAFLGSSNESHPKVNQGIISSTDTITQDETEKVNKGNFDKSTKIYDKHDIQIFAEKILYDDEGVPSGIDLKFVNNSKSSYGIRAKQVVVNSVSMGDEFSTPDVASGKIAYYTIWFSDDLVNQFDIKSVTDLYFEFLFYKDGGLLPEYDDVASVKTSAYGKYEQKTIKCKKVLYDKDGIKVSEISVEPNSDGTMIYFLFENNTDETLTFDCDDFSVGGVMLSNEFSFVNTEMPPNSKTVTSHNILHEDLEEVGVSQFTDCECVFSTDDVRENLKIE